MKFILRATTIVVICSILYITYPNDEQVDVNAKETIYLYENDEMVSISAEPDTVSYIKENENKWPNVSTTSSRTILDISEETKSLNSLQTSAEEELAKGYMITIDDEYTFYVKDKKDYENAINNIISVYVSDAAYQTYLNSGKIPEFVKGDKAYTDFYIGSDIKITKGEYNTELLLDDAESVQYFLVNGNNTPQYSSVNSDTTIQSIISDNNLTETEFYLNNPNITSDTLFYDNQQVITNKPSLIIELVGYYTTIEEREIAYQQFEEPSLDYLIGETKLKQDGQPGIEELEYKNKEINGQLIEQTVLDNTVLLQPINEILIVGTHEIPDVGTGTFIWPESCTSITNGYLGYYGHDALDIQCGYGMEIYAADNGVVIKNEYMAGGYGNYVMIDHNNGFKTLYGHMAQPSQVPVGTVVHQGQVIGYEGNTGNSTGHHLHFETRVDGATGYAPNPETFYTVESNGSRKGIQYTSY